MMTMPCVFVNHGGGPTHAHGDKRDPIKAHLVDLGKRFNKKGTEPKSILVISAHHEASPSLKVSSGFRPSRYSRQIYDAAVDAELAKKIQIMLNSNNISCEMDKKHSLDHGSVTPLMIAFPKANIPVVALSLHRSLDPKIHLKIGKILQPLREQGVLIMGSGMSFHNLNSFFSSRDSTLGFDFDQKLTKAVTLRDSDERNYMLTKWETFPGARNAHPREEHLMPLLVVAGAAGADVGRQSSSFSFMGASVSGYSFP